MPLARIEIEQTAQHRWVAEVEAGGVSARAARVHADSVDGILAAVGCKYHELDRLVRTTTRPATPTRSAEPALLPDLTVPPMPVPPVPPVPVLAPRKRGRWILALKRRRG